MGRRDAVAASVSAYAKYADRYDATHGEIFNEPEQQRLRDALGRAIAAIRSGGGAALDYGCGSGNLTRHLLSLGLTVTATDVSPHFLRMVSGRYSVPTFELRDGDVDCVPADTFDLIAMYSVLHHVPDYLGTVAALIGKLRPGGVLFIDHEHNERHWTPPSTLQTFRAELAATPSGAWWDPEHKRWQHLVRAGLTPSRHLHRYHRWRDPRYSREGDIHVWPNDHIEFGPLAEWIAAAGGEVVEHSDYLLYKSSYDQSVWERYRSSCADMSCLVARRL
jgi:SAM-dependent methyltransferase